MKQVKRIDSDRYDFAGVEKRWRAYWDDIDLYRTGSDPRKPNIYILDFFPYPSGAGLSVGHCRNYIPTCVSARFHRMRGYNVLHPMGWDAFGLPAENYAIRHKIHPRESSAQFCATYKRQMELIACSYDWSREFSSAGPDFYRWTQWFFLLLYERGLAYKAISSQWWCPECQTILANEQVENSRCWRCDSEVEKKELEQWHLRITDYADRLLQDLETIDWPEAIKRMQRNWIGRSEGVEISFSLNPDQGKARDSEAEVVVFTTRPDTLYGATFLVLAPEHPLAERVATADRADAVRAMIDVAGNRSERERSAENEQMRGEFSGRYAVHPMTGEPVPIWVADYVLPGYGTGAIMAVPAHDDRDYAFAKAHDLPIVEVVGDAGLTFAEGNIEELQTIASRGISASRVNQILVEEAVVGWEELELEVVRDAKNQMITVCFIENVDAMGVHTGDSYCTAPMLTISAELQQKLQEYSYAIVEAIEVVGGTNVQFAHDPKTGRVVAFGQKTG